jgi:secretion/DNA translocation related CpaE-like protein
MTGPLFITRDDDLLDELLRLAAAAGVTPEVAGEGRTALASWSSAPLVLVGLDVLEGLARCQPPRRDGVHLATLRPVPDGSLPHVLAVHAEAVTSFPQSAGWLVEQLTDLGNERPQRGQVVGVLGGSGGAGASVLAAALAQVAGPAAVLLDLDPLGPGLDRVFGLERADGVRWEDLGQTTGRISAQSLRDGLPRASAVGVLTWRSAPDGWPATFTVREALSAARRGHEVVVLDLPRSGGERWQETVSRCDRVLVVVRPTLAGVASAARLLARLPDRRRARIVLRGVGLGASDVASALGVPVVADAGDNRRVSELVELGLGPVRGRRSALARAAAACLATLSVPDQRAAA